MNDGGTRRLGGLVIVAGSVGQLIAAWLPDRHVFMSSDAHVQLDAIAKRPLGWRVQAVGFPLAFAVTGIGFAAVASTMPEPRSRRLAMAASALNLSSVLMWLPITARRLSIAEQPAAVNIGARTFWPYTLATLGSIITLSCALIAGGLHRRFAAVIASLSALAVMLLPKFRDWPPFLSYVITLAIGLRVAWPKRTGSPSTQR
jgi:hypothetical protein